MSIKNAYVMPHPPIVLPEVGRGEEKKLHKTTAAFEKVAQQIAQEAPQTIVLSTPHASIYRDYFQISKGREVTGDMAQFRAPEVSFTLPYDTEFVHTLSQLAEEQDLPAGTLGQDGALDHGTLIPLYYIQQAYTEYELVRISISGLSAQDHFHLGQLIMQTAQQLDRRTVFIASGDLSHRLKEDGPYGYTPEGPAFDQKTAELLDSGDFDEFLHLDPAMTEEAGECGLRSLQILAGIIDGRKTQTELLSYEGPFGVGYAISSVHIQS